jgi:hypothetical protein
VSSLDKVTHVKIMYIAPDSVIDKELKSEDANFIDDLHKIAFSELLEMDFDDDWNTIKGYIRELNTPLEKDRSKKERALQRKKDVAHRSYTDTKVFWLFAGLEHQNGKI